MAVYLVSTETPKNKLTYILPVVLGFAIEVVGTNTGWPFGEYTYGSALGLSIAHTIDDRCVVVAFDSFYVRCIVGEDFLRMD